MTKFNVFKRALSLLCFAALLSALYGCGNKVPDSLSSDSFAQATDESNKLDDNSYYIDSVKDFSDGCAWVAFRDSQNNKKQACIDTKGEVQFVIEDILNEPKPYTREYENGYAVVNDSDNYYIIDKKGNITSSSKDGNYDKIVSYGDGYFLAEKYNNNDLHEVNYTYFVIDCNGKTLASDCFVLKDSSPSFDYRRNGVFTYCVQRYDLLANTRYKYDCFNVKTKQKFTLDHIETFFDYTGEQTIIVGKEDIQLSDANGNVKDLVFPEMPFGSKIAVLSGITNNSFVYCIRNNDSGDDHDNSLYIYNISSGQINELYHCGQGIYAELCDYNEKEFLLKIRDNTKSKTWFVIIDYQGKNLFEPIEGEPTGLSCDRIVTQSNIYDNKGNMITAANTDPLGFSKKYHDNLVAVKNNKNGDTDFKNYIDINGNFLFPENRITL